MVTVERGKSMIPQLLDHWLEEIKGRAYAVSRDPIKDASSNLLIFSLSDAQNTKVEVEELDGFLLQVSQHFTSILAKRVTDAWFYAWFDEMSGTLRCSACQVSNPAQLPFACRFETVDIPRPISSAALGSPYASGIPWSQLSRLDTWEENEASDKEFVLTVFVRRI